jgi:hypothetical protein
MQVPEMRASDSAGVARERTSPWIKRYPARPSLYAAFYALILRHQGIAPDEIRYLVLERFAGYREVQDQLATPGRRHVFGD